MLLALIFSLLLPIFLSNPPDDPPSSNIPSKSFEPIIDEDLSDDNLEDDSDSQGNIVWIVMLTVMSINNILI